MRGEHGNVVSRHSALVIYHAGISACGGRSGMQAPSTSSRFGSTAVEWDHGARRKSSETGCTRVHLCSGSYAARKPPCSACAIDRNPSQEASGPVTLWGLPGTRSRIRLIKVRIRAASWKWNYRGVVGGVDSTLRTIGVST